MKNMRAWASSFWEKLLKVWNSDKLMGLATLILLALVVLAFVAYNVLAVPLQIRKIAAARVDIQDISQEIQQVADIRFSEIGQKDTIPADVYEQLVLLQSALPKAKVLPSAWATELFTDDIADTDKTIEQIYADYSQIYKSYDVLTGNYLRLIVITQPIIEYNFINDFALTAPTEGLFDRKIDAQKENNNRAIDSLNNIKQDNTNVTKDLIAELGKINRALDDFADSRDIEAPRSEIEQAQRQIINLLSEYWRTESNLFLKQAGVSNSELSFVELALR